MQPLSPETTIKILRSSLQYNLPNDCQALAKQRLSCVARGKGGWKSTRQEPTLEKLNLRLPLQRYRTRRPGFPGHPAPLRRGAPPARCQRPEPQLAAALRRLPVRGAAGAAGVQGGRRNRRKVSGEGAGAPPTTRAPREEPAGDPACGKSSNKGPAPPVGARGRGGRPRRRRRSRPPASGRPAASPRSRPSPRLAGRPYSPSRAVPMSWSSRARICAWADMVAGGSGRSGRDGFSQTAAAAAAGATAAARRQRRRVASASNPLGFFPPRGTPGGIASAPALGLLGNVV